MAFSGGWRSLTAMDIPAGARPGEPLCWTKVMRRFKVSDDWKCLNHSRNLRWKSIRRTSWALAPVAWVKPTRKVLSSP